MGTPPPPPAYSKKICTPLLVTQFLEGPTPTPPPSFVQSESAGALTIFFV